MPRSEQSGGGAPENYTKPDRLDAIAEYGNADSTARWLEKWWLAPEDHPDYVLVAIRNAASVQSAAGALLEQYLTIARGRGIPEAEIEAALQPVREGDHDE